MPWRVGWGLDRARGPPPTHTSSLLQSRESQGSALCAPVCGLLGTTSPYEAWSKTRHNVSLELSSMKHPKYLQCQRREKPLWIRVGALLGLGVLPLGFWFDLIKISLPMNWVSNANGGWAASESSGWIKNIHTHICPSLLQSLIFSRFLLFNSPPSIPTPSNCEA